MIHGLQLQSALPVPWPISASSCTKLHFTLVKSPPPFLHRRQHRRALFNLNRHTPSFSVSSDFKRRESIAEALQQEALQTPEWDAVCKRLSSFTSTLMGRFSAENGIVCRAVDGEVLSVGVLCALGRALRSVKGLVEQIEAVSHGSSLRW